MHVPANLPTLIVRSAMGDPYRQIRVMPTEKFRVWLTQRDVPFQRWQTLHHLWTLGVVHPIAVTAEALAKTPNLPSQDRFVEVDLGQGEQVYADRGVAAIDITRMRPPDNLSSSLRDTVYWHPFQLHLFDRLANILKPNVSVDMTLYGADEYAKITHRLQAQVPSFVSQFAMDDRHTSFLRVLALLLAIEPLVHPTIHNRITYQTSRGESSEGYFAWRDSVDAKSFLAASGLSVDQAERWHHDLAAQAQLTDPLDDFRILLRHASREHREKLRGKALQAHDLYDTAEKLRRYLEGYHDRVLLEEDDIRYGPSHSDAKERRYGVRRTSDFNRTAFRRITREYGLDPQARVTWFVEGETEEAFIRELARGWGLDLENSGIYVQNLFGKDRIDANKVLRDVLERLRREEVFAFVALDHDGGGDHIRVLERLAEAGFLPAGYRIWTPDFEAENFSVEELATVANLLASQQGVNLTLTGADISCRMAERGEPAGKAVVALLHANQVQGGKGAEWGVALARWATENVAPGENGGDRDIRPIEVVMNDLRRGQWSNYMMSVQTSVVGEKGQLVNRKTLE